MQADPWGSLTTQAHLLVSPRPMRLCLKNQDRQCPRNDNWTLASTCMITHIHLHTHEHVRTCRYTHIYMHTHMDTCRCVHTNTHVCTFMHTCTHTGTYIYVHIHTAYGVVGSSVYVCLLLVNELKNCFEPMARTGQNQAGKARLYAGRKRVELERSHGSTI